MKHRLTKDAPPWAREVERLFAERGGFLRASDVVDWARANPDSALHKRFDWDDRSAARKHREDTARSVLREIEVYVEKRPDLLVPIAIHLRRDGDGYRLTAEALESRPGEVTREEARRLLFAIDRAEMFPGLKGRAKLLEARADLVALVESLEEEDEAA